MTKNSATKLKKNAIKIILKDVVVMMDITFPIVKKIIKKDLFYSEFNARLFVLKAGKKFKLNTLKPVNKNF